MSFHWYRLNILVAVGIGLCIHHHASGQTLDSTFQPSGKAILQVFGFAKYDASKGANQPVSFGCTRAFLGYQYFYTEKVSAKLIIDAAGRPTTLGMIAATDSTGGRIVVQSTGKDGSYYTAYLKQAYIQWEPIESLTLQGGGIVENHYITQEKFWGYRYVYETFQDRYFGSPSTDFGAIGYFHPNKAVAFDIAVTNGEGIRSQQDSHGKIKLASGLDCTPLNGLVTRLYYASTPSGDPKYTATQHLYSILLGLKLGNSSRIGVDYNYRANDLNVPDHNFWGYSLFGTYAIVSSVELFFRYDKVASNVVQGSTQSWNVSKDGEAYVAGIHVQPATTINVSLNYQGWNPENNAIRMTYLVSLNTEFKY